MSLPPPGRNPETAPALIVSFTGPGRLVPLRLHGRPGSTARSAQRGGVKPPTSTASLVVSYLKPVSRTHV